MECRMAWALGNATRSMITRPALFRNQWTDNKCRLLPINDPHNSRRLMVVCFLKRNHIFQNYTCNSRPLESANLLKSGRSIQKTVNRICRAKMAFFALESFLRNVYSEIARLLANLGSRLGSCIQTFQQHLVNLSTASNTDGQNPSPGGTDVGQQQNGQHLHNSSSTPSSVSASTPMNIKTEVRSVLNC